MNEDTDRYGYSFTRSKALGVPVIDHFKVTGRIVGKVPVLPKPKTIAERKARKTLERR